MLVAPVTIGDGAYTAAGSVITEDVPPGRMGVGAGAAAQRGRLGSSASAGTPRQPPRRPRPRRAAAAERGTTTQRDATDEQRIQAAEPARA